MIKKTIISCFLITLSAMGIFAQNTSINISLAGASAPVCELWVHDPPVKQEYFRKGYQPVVLNQQKSAVISFNLKQAQFITLSCDADSSGKKSFSYMFFLSPGDHLVFKADFTRTGNGIVVSGKGSNNNQPLIGTMAEVNVRPFYGDTLPNRVMDAIKKQQAINKAVVDQYILKYKPSASFIKNWRLNLVYASMQTYYAFKENNKFGKQHEAYVRNLNQWQKVQDSLFTSGSLKPRPKNLIIQANDIKQTHDDGLNNQGALTSYQYTRLIDNFLLREKEHLWEESEARPEQFYKEWYNTNVANGKKLLQDDTQNLLKEKIINKFFTGAPAEYLYALLFQDAVDESNPQNVALIFAHFKRLYPASKYVKWYGSLVSEMVKKQQQTLNDKMIFAADNGSKLNTLNDILNLTKGKTVLVDMWGTWCGPCRMEITKNSAAIKSHFKNQGLDYLYVANHDAGNEKTWKKLIAYFHLEGTHVLANDALDQDIMKQVKGEGYPTYFIIKKDGTYELSKAGYPMNRDMLIKQLEDALAEK